MSRVEMTPPTSLARAERARLTETFVGRELELALGQAMIRGAVEDRVGADAPQLLYLHGPGGIGKTTLLAMLAAHAEEASVRVYRLDCRDFEPSPAALDLALAPLDLSADDVPTLLLIDTFELLRPIDDRVRTEVVERLGRRAIALVASRSAPSGGWRTMASWGDRVRGVALDKLSLGEAKQYLELRRVEARDIGGVLRFAKGNPLALALAVDVERAGDRGELVPERDPDVVTTLCERLLRVEVDPGHQATLELCGLMRSVTEEVIAALTTNTDPSREFRWLREKTFVRATPSGLAAHDLARDAIAEELRWRNPARFDDLQRRGLAWLADRADRPGVSFDDTLLQVTHLVRNIPSLAALFDLPIDSDLVLDVARREDCGQMREIVAKYEGPTNAALIEHWFARQPEAFQIIRDARGTVAGLSALLGLERTSEADRAPDLAARTVWEHARRRLAPHDRGEVVFCRFTMGRDQYQAAAEQMIWASFLAVQPLRLPTISLSYSYIRTDHLFWTEAWKLTGAAQLTLPTYEIDGVGYLVGTIDRRRITPGRWLADTAKRALASMERPDGPPSAPGSTPTRASVEFAEAVRVALRSFHDTKRLAESPLVTMLAMGPERGAERVNALRARLRRSIESLGSSPKHVRHARVLMTTYVNGAESQELAADALGLSFGTYRRYLQQAADELTERLWFEVSK